MLYDEARKRSNAIYPALALALNCGLRDREIRRLQWGHVHLDQAYLVVGETKTDAGSGRTVPLNKPVLIALNDYALWFQEKFGIPKPEWFLFPIWDASTTDPTKPCTSYVSKQMLRHYSYIRMEAKRKALDAITQNETGAGKEGWITMDSATRLSILKQCRYIFRYTRPGRGICHFVNC